MGRAKLQIKRIQNMTSRQVTFSKRRNGLIKKAYEISVLCDVDIALLLFSPSGRLSLFSGKTRTEDVLERFANLRGNERERLQNEELLRMGMNKLRQEHTQSQQQTSSSGSNDPPEKDTQREILSCKSQLRDLRKQLRVFEGDLSEITSVCEAENVETILQETLRKVLARKQVLQQQCSSSETLAGLLHVNRPQPLPPPANSGHLGAAFLPDWSPQAIVSQIEAVFSSLDENCVLGSSHPQREDGATPSSSTLLPKVNAITENCIDIFQLSHFFPTTRS